MKNMCLISNFTTISWHTQLLSVSPYVYSPYINLLDAKLVLAPVDGNASPTLLAEAATVIKHRLIQVNLKGQFEVTVQAEHLEITLTEGQDVPYVSTQ